MMLFSSWGCSYVSGFDLCLQEQVFTENDGFFAWMFLKRRTLWQTILSFVWPLFALAVCLFPVYPYQCKIVVLYSCAGALLFIVSILLRKISLPRWVCFHSKLLFKDWQLCTTHIMNNSCLPVLYTDTYQHHITLWSLHLFE